ncbi:manganese-dependent inorganic pyrophosphatase [Collinsella sp. AGMB00827]|uniref:inorganic diphosphatase n=1 Tax=Collinsella ureilytica TaxID=2869515 RepID=A0ABS7MJG0_9ACTN|nr:manganese-dependent inorganic pyrophosphatase [Collinsella urealyticum]MBY4797501.1 manganese-dependent inorganic pyrophosphatase [Collinsella urealyticum]
MSTILVVGHQNPDNDAIMSALMFAQLKNALNDGNTYVPCRLGPLPKESALLLERLGIEEPRFIEGIEPPAKGEERQQIILTDHNELGQSVPGREHANIVGLIDHHRIGNFETSQPPFAVVLPWGSSCTVITYLFDAYGVEISDAQASCLLAAMMTDTVMLKSPTATDVDRRFAERLAKQLGVDPVEYGKEIFKSRGSGDFTPRQMVERDIKRFEIGGKNLFIGQYETVDGAAALQELPEIRKAMEEYRKEHDAAGVVLLITDILEEGSQVLLSGDTEVAQRGLGIADVHEGVWMPGVLSRKKQVAAPIIAAAH